jgi:drug/metabolite transporter (DMT)-like permease
VHAYRQQRQRAAGIDKRCTRDWPAGLAWSAAGAFVGPFLGVWMSLEAADRVPLGIAQTLVSLPPVFVLPFSRLVYHERIGPRAVVGAIIAVAGVATLFAGAG